MLFNSDGNHGNLVGSLLNDTWQDQLDNNDSGNTHLRITTNCNEQMSEDTSAIEIGRDRGTEDFAHVSRPVYRTVEALRGVSGDAMELGNDFDSPISSLDIEGSEDYDDDSEFDCDDCELGMDNVRHTERTFIIPRRRLKEVRVLCV